MKDLKARIAEREQREEEAKKAAEAEGTANTDNGGDGDEGYKSNTKAELKAELDRRGVEYASGDSKDDLIAALEANDAEG